MVNLGVDSAGTIDEKEREREAIRKMVQEARDMKLRLESGVDKLLGTMKREDGYLHYIQSSKSEA